MQQGLTRFGAKALIGPAAALAALLVGSAVYVFDREAGSAAFLPAAWSLRAHTGSVFGGLAGSLPAFAHAFAFTVLTTLTVGPSARSIRRVAIFWAALLSAFELGQIDAVAAQLVPIIQALVPSTLGSGRLSAYFARGVFDPLDLAATCLGCLAAAGGLHALRHREPTLSSY